jgi:hypothetical protein
MNPDFDSLIVRLASLERSCTRWRAFGACLAVVLVLLGTAGAMAPAEKVLTVQTLRVVDEKGKERVVLEGTGGAPGLAVYDAEETSRVILGVARDGAAFLMFAEGETETNRIMLGLNADGVPLLLMKDEKGVARLGAGVYAKVGPGLRMLDASKKVIARMP